MDDLFRAGTLMVFATIIAGAINYFYQIFMARTLGQSEYGEFSALYSLSFFLSFLLLRAVRDSNARFISRFRGTNNLEAISSFHRRMIKRMLVYGIIGLAVFSLLSGLIADFLRIDSVALVLLIGFVFFIAWIQPVNLGTMQGLQRFRHFAYNIIVQAGAKVIIGVGLVLLGFGIFGAVWGLVLGFAVSLLVSFYLIRDIIRSRHDKPDESDGHKVASITGAADISDDDKSYHVKDISKYSFFVLLAVACITIPTNIDILIVKHFFSSEETAHYTAAAVFGRMILFLPIGITRVMYPKVVEGHTKRERTKSILNRGLMYTCLPTGLLVLLFWLFPGFFLGLFFGNDYLVAEPLLQLYAPLMFFFSLTTVIVYYNLARNRYGFVLLFTAFSIVELVLVWLYHNPLILILQIFLIMIVIFFVLGTIITYSYNEEKENI
jgi:O-antigen/teichoic acid export membrane protein